jgi:hypothetical protein
MRSSSLIALVFLFALFASGQEAGAPEYPPRNQDSAPPVMLGQSSRRAPFMEAVTPNYLSGGVSVMQMWTDNAEIAATHPISDLSWDIEPNIALNHFTPRLSYDLGVSAGFVINRRLNERNLFTQSAAADLSYGLAQFVTLRVSDRFTNSTGLWSGAGGGTNGENGSGIGPIQQPNPSLFTYAEYRANTALAELTTQLNATSFAGVRGTYSYLSYPTAPTDPIVGTLYGGNSYSAEVFYNHRFTLRNWGGITLRGERFDISRIAGRTDTGSLLFFYAYNFRPTLSLSFFGGPELSVTALPEGMSIPPSFPRRQWSPAAGAVFSGVGRRMSGSASLIHELSDGGGLASAVTLNTADVHIIRQIASRLLVGPGFMYAQSTPIMPSPTIRTYSARIELTYQLRTCYFTAGYARDSRTALDTLPSASANRVWVGFHYGFLRPLGR